MSKSEKQTEPKSTEDEIDFNMRTSFSWDKAFYTNDGFLDAEELLSVIQGDGDDDDDVNHELQKIESLEVKLFQELEASTQNSPSNLSSGKKDSQSKKVTTAQTASSSSSSTPVKIVQPTRSSPSSGGSITSPGNKVRSPARRSASSKTANATATSPSHGIPTKKVSPVNTRISRTSPASPVSSGSSPSSSSSSSKFGVNQRSKRGTSVPCRSSVNSEKSPAMKTSKPAIRLIPKTQSSISLKIKPPPVISNPSSTSPSESSLSSSTHMVNQKSKLKGEKGSTVQHRSKSTLKNSPAGHSPDQNGKQPAASRIETTSPIVSKPRKLLTSKTVAAVNAGLKPYSQKTTTAKPSKKQSSAKTKSSKNIILISPEVMDIKGKLNALKMEIRMQKKERCKETNMGHDESGTGESSSIIRMNKQKM